ncbi:MAG: Ig-like domain-containing protein [Nanoarchaeota archaeon]|nr:Ig-like domain-containing protein [Nanoarchaeota archaeon]
MNIKNSKIIVMIIIIVISLTGVLAVSKTFSVQETELVRLKTNTLDKDNDTVNITYSLPLNSSGEWQTGYNDAGMYSIKITASDHKDTTTESVTLIVEEKNQAPSIDHPPITVSEGEIVALDFPEVDADGDRLSYSFEPPVNEQGVWQTTSADAGKYQFKASVSDGELTSLLDLDVTVLNRDQEVVLNIPDTIEAYENQKLELVINAVDPDGDDPFMNVINLPEGASFDSETKIFSWTPSFDTVKRTGGIVSTALNALRLENTFIAEKDFPPLAIELCSSDECTVTEIPVKVYNVNQKPMLDIPENIVIKETEGITLKAAAVDPDGDVVHYSFSPPLEQWQGSWKTKYGDRGEYNLTVTASDGKLEEVVPVTITVLPFNRQPHLTIKHDELTVNEGELVEFSVSASDPDNDTLTTSVLNLPPGATFNDGIFSWTPPSTTVTNRSTRWEDNLISSVAFVNKVLSSESNIRWVEFMVSDGEYEVIHPVKLTVKNVNQKPQLIDFLPLSTITARVHEPLLFHIAAKDNDQDTLSYEWSFSFHESKVKGTDTIERTFITPGKKKILVTVNDGREKIVKEWTIDILEQAVKPIDPDNFKVYVFEG